MHALSTTVHGHLLLLGLVQVFLHLLELLDQVLVLDLFSKHLVLSLVSLLLLDDHVLRQVKVLHFEHLQVALDLLQSLRVLGVGLFLLSEQLVVLLLSPVLLHHQGLSLLLCDEIRLFLH